MGRLIVKNFGPLKNIDIELNKINLFIGENGSGKSVLGKLITVLYNLTELNKENFIDKMNDFQINFLKKDTEIIFYINDNILFKYSNRNMESLLDLDEISKIHGNTNDILEKFKHYLSNFNIDSSKLNNDEIVEFIEFLFNDTENKKIKNFLTQIKILEYFKSSYIPSERNFISIISRSLSSFIVADIPLPKYFIQFASDFENSANKIKELKVLNVHYKYGDGLDRHKVFFDEKNYLPLNESSSGIQAVIPLLITYQYFNQKYQTIVIEEPEQNLFPKAQKEVVDFLIENLQEKNRLFLMTHSPYILTALNNLILANDVKEAKGEEAIKGLVKVSQCIPFENINAYYIKDGKAVNIMDKENRLIGVNVIDEISDEVNETFDILLSKLD